MTTRRDFLKALGVGAAVAAIPITVGEAIANAEAKSRLQIGPTKSWDKPEYPRLLEASTPVTAADNTIHVCTGQGVRLKPNDVVLNINTREQFLVLDIRRDEIRVLRGFASFSYSVDTGDKLIVLSSGVHV